MNKDVVHIHNRILLSHKEDQIMSFAATKMQPEIIILSGLSERNAMIVAIHGIRNMTQMNLSIKQSHGQREQLVVAKVGGGVWGRDGV